MGRAENDSSRVRPAVLFGIAALLLGAVFISLLIISRSLFHVADYYAPLTDAVTKVVFQTSRFHVSFEEAMRDEKGAGEEVWDFLDRADGYARALLEGGESGKERSRPLDDPRLREEAGRIVTGLKVVRSIAMERLIDGEAGGSALDAQFDEAIAALLRHADHVESELRKAVAGEVRTIRLALYTLSGAVVLLAFGIGYILFRYGRVISEAATRSR